MKAYVELGSQGALRAAGRGDVIVLIDALRASVTIACGLQAGASRVIPVLTVEQALGLRRKHGFRVAGERGGIKVDGFDFGNSPRELLANRDRLQGQPLVLTTSNGTRCVRAGLSGGAPAVLAAAPPNASAAVRATSEIAARLGRNVTLLAAGLDDGHNDEDLFTARVLLRMLEARHGSLGASGEGEWADPDDSTGVFANSEAGQRLSRLGYAADVAFCSQFDSMDVVPVYQDGLGFVPLHVWVKPLERTTANG